MEKLQENQRASGSAICTRESLKETRNEETNRSLQLEENDGSNESHDRELPQPRQHDLAFRSLPIIERGDNDITSSCVTESGLQTTLGSDNVFDNSSDEIDSFPIDQTEASQGMEYSDGKSTNTNQEKSLQKLQELPIQANAIAEEEEYTNDETRAASPQNDETEEEVNNRLSTKKCCIIH